MSNLTATLSTDGYVTVEIGGIRKNISIKDYITVLKSLTVSGNSGVDSSGVSTRYPVSVHSVTDTSFGKVVNLYYPECQRTLTHVGVGSKDIYLPNIMIRVELREISGKTNEFAFGNIRWYATDKSRSMLGTEWPEGYSDSSHIWTLPLPNVFNDSRMCLGQNRLPSVIYLDWTVLDMLYTDVLIGSPFNNDLSIPTAASTSDSEDWFKKLAKHTETSDSFPYHLLRNY